VHILLIVLQVIICVGLIAVILMQSGKSAGLSGAIAGASETFFGKKKGMDALLAKITIVLAIAFFVISLIITVVKF
jgi:preprotein translocase subunit SecG